MLSQQGGHASVIFYSVEEARRCLPILQSMSNYKGEPYKCRLIESFELKEQRPRPQGAEPEQRESPERTLVQVTSPYLCAGQGEELYMKQKMVRNALSNQFHRLIRGQTLQSQFSVAKTHTVDRKMPAHLQYRRIRRNCMSMPPIADSPVQSHYRTKGEFKVYACGGKVVVGSFYRLHDNAFRVFGAEEMAGEQKIFPVVFVECLQVVQDVLNGGALATADPGLVNEDGNYVVIQSAGVVEDGGYRVAALLVTLHTTERAVALVHPARGDIEGRLRELGTRRAVAVQFQVGDEGLSVEQRIGDAVFRIASGSFFQVNLAVQTLVLDHVADYVQGIVERDGTAARLYDVCCGCGVIGQCLLKRVGAAARLVGIEVVAEAVAAAEEAARLNGVADRCTYVCAPAEDCTDVLGEAGIAILDPPRSGLHKSVLRALRESHIAHIVYISCNPRTLACDLYSLCAVDYDRGRYGTVPFYVESVKAFNMFKWCEHVETVVFLERCCDGLGEVAEAEREKMEETGEDPS